MIRLTSTPTPLSILQAYTLPESDALIRSALLGPGKPYVVFTCPVVFASEIQPHDDPKNTQRGCNLPASISDAARRFFRSVRRFFGRVVGPLPNVTGLEVPDMSTPPIEEAHSNDSSSVQLDLDDQPGPSGTSGQSVPLTLAETPTEPPPSGNTSTAPTQWAHTSVPRTRQAAVCPPLQGTQANPPPQQQQGPGGSGSGHTVQGTEAKEQRGTGRAAVRQGEGRPREPALHEALSNIMGAYHHSQETMATVLAKFQETQRLQEEQYLGLREELKSINTTLGSIVGLLKELVNTRMDTVAQQGAPDTSLDDELPTTSASASGQEAPPQDHDTRTPPPADGEPPANGT
ncbi:hypothetical protein NDU88_003496 [Pleurodeles waltl]|uniref:Uncharacterized protein n=1 Tax=Pleurodeles waltl TaxID=8319 RepID=A0AAV7VEC4_PLEWA|nr:hypothetical protein NDU88_003496 [Pleurodeles waltl]